MSVIEKKLKSLAEKNHTARELFQNLLSRERTRSTTDLARYRRSLKKSLGKPVDPNEYLRTWRDLAQLGVGELVKAGKSTQFKWSWDMRKVAKIALSDIALKQSKTEVQAAVVEAITQPSADWQTVQVKLKLGGSAVIVIPKNFTKEDIGAVAEQLQGIAS